MENTASFGISQYHNSVIAPSDLVTGNTGGGATQTSGGSGPIPPSNWTPPTGSGAATGSNTGGTVGLPTGNQTGGGGVSSSQWLHDLLTGGLGGLFPHDTQTTTTTTVDVTTGCPPPNMLVNGKCMPPKKSNNTVWYVVGGVAGLSVIGLVIYLVTRPKK